MPVRSLSSSVLKWPSSEEVLSAARRWAEGLRRQHREVVAVGVFGSYARGEGAFGSDLDLVVLVTESDAPPLRRSAAWPSEDLPVPSDILTYTLEEWSALAQAAGFRRTLWRETAWLVGNPGR